jgi:hypothetical protein
MRRSGPLGAVAPKTNVAVKSNRNRLRIIKTKVYKLFWSTSRHVPSTCAHVLRKPTADSLNDITDDNFENHNRKIPNMKQNFQIVNHDILRKK